MKKIKLKIKIEDIFRNLFLGLVYTTCLIIVFLFFNKLCNNCIVKNPKQLLNPQGYAFSIKYNAVDDFDKQTIENNQESTKPSKVRFSKEKTTGFMGFVQEESKVNPRVCN